MLTRVFLSVAELSIALAPVLAALLLLAGSRAGRRYSARLRGLVWMVVALRLLVPFNAGIDGLGLRLDLAGQARGARAEASAPQEDGERPRPAAVLPDGEPSAAQSGAFVYEPEDGAPARRADPLQAAALVWGAGGALYLLVHLALHLRCMRRLRRWSEPVRDERVRALFAELRGEYRVTRGVGLSLCALVDSPVLVGLFRPRVILPRGADMDGEALAIVLRHELCHLRRGDLWRKLALLLAGALYWFHPLVHLLRRRAVLDIEIACDGEVLDGAGAALRREYGFAVLGVMGGKPACRTALSTQFFGGKKQMMQRFGQMVDTGPKRRGILPAALALIAVLGCGLFVGCGEPVRAEQREQPALQLVGPEDLDEARGPEDGIPADMDLAAMEELFLSDLDYYQPLMAQVQDELVRIMEQLEQRDEPYGDGAFAWPVPGHYTVSSSYGFRFNGSDFHTGMDITGDGIYGADVVAAADGEVLFVNLEYTQGLGYGIYMIVDHGGSVATLYAQLSEVLVEPGDQVARGQAIARVGSTGFSAGPHLHFEVREDGAHTDPAPYVTGSGAEETDGFLWPADGGSMESATTPGMTGVSIARDAGAPIYASRAGTVSAAREMNTGYGNHIIIDHGDGYTTVYAHASALHVQTGDAVAQGQHIADVGRSGNATGYALYFEIRYNGEALDPADFLVAPGE